MAETRAGEAGSVPAGASGPDHADPSPARPDLYLTQEQIDGLMKAIKPRFSWFPIFAIAFLVILWSVAVLTNDAWTKGYAAAFTGFAIGFLLEEHRKDKVAKRSLAEDLAKMEKNYELTVRYQAQNRHNDRTPAGFHKS